MRDVDDTMRIANEEIFGPGLVVTSYSALTDVIAYVNDRPAPLVSYWYGPDDADFRRFVGRTQSGGVARNDFAAQMVPSAAPFGGVGRSGMGAYHGKAGFDTFQPHPPASAAVRLERSQNCSAAEDSRTVPNLIAYRHFVFAPGAAARPSRARATWT